MANQLLSEDQVKEYLNISDFRRLTRDKLIEFVSAIPNMDKEVAIKTIEQFPAFTEYAKVLVAHFETMYGFILRENDSSVQFAMSGYQQTLNVLGEMIKDTDISLTDKHFFAEKMVEVADKMAAIDINNKNFLKGLTKYITWFACGTLFICAAVLGFKHMKIKIPHLT